MNLGRPRCVVTTHFLPVPTGGGTPIRVASTVEALAREFEVTVVCTAPFSAAERDAARSFLDGIGARVVHDAASFVPPDPGSIALRSRLLLGASSRIAEASIAAPESPVLAALVRDADLLWVCRITPFLHRRMPIPPSGAVVVDVDDLDEVVIARDPNFDVARRRIIATAIQRARRRILEDASVALVCSDADAARLVAPCAVRVLPNTYRPIDGVTPSRGVADAAGAPTVALVGEMGYAPNREGAEWLLREVWPIVLRRRPDARLVIVGRGSESLAPVDPGASVRSTGRVDDVAPIVDAASVVLAPIPYGSGTRVKILEGFAHARPVVSTTAGAEGIDAVDGDSILLADDARTFAAMIVQVLADDAMADRIGRAGRELFEQRYAFDHFRSRVLSIAREALVGDGDRIAPGGLRHPR